MIALVGTPWSGSPAVELAENVWKKKLLPLGDVSYKGRVLHFDRDYLDGLATAFADGAYGQVPFQIADASNAHTNDPERYRGEVVSMDADDTGLWITVSTTPAGNRLLMTNPKLGISARIIEHYARSDGQRWPAAVQHVLGTLDPRIPALGEWQPVDFSAYDSPDIIIDLSTAHFAGEPAPEPGDGDLSDEDLFSVLAEFLEPDELAVYAEHGEQALLEYLQDKHDAGQHRVADPAIASVSPNGDGTQFASDYQDLGTAVELAAQAAQIRAIEDAAPAAPRDEDRLATALSRLQAGTYLPTTAQRTLGFAADDTPAGPDEGCSCGAIGRDGSTLAAHHLAGCDAVELTPDDWAIAAEAGMFQGWATQTATDANGYERTDQYGRPLSLTGLLESATGQRLTREDPFSGLAPGLARSREVLVAQRAQVFGDPDDPDDPGLEFSPATRQAAQDAAAQMGLASRSAAAIRDAAIGQMAFGRNPARPRSYGAAADLFGETMTERAERLKTPGGLAEFGDEPLHGSQPVYTHHRAA
jgi:hypothetical protein